ncbi:MAG: hypothetical protein ACO36A_02385 [Ilumatobacteraceae bacterium]
MAVTDAQRLQVQRAFEDNMGKDNAELVMEHLPPGGWATLATKNDLLMTETRLTARIDGLEHRIDGLERQVDSVDGRMKWLISIVLTVGLALFASQVQILLTIKQL